MLTAIICTALEQAGIKDNHFIQAKAKAIRKEIVLEQDKLERYISTIGDSFTRQIFIFRFVQGLSWEQVASSLDRAEKWESIKQICYRYVRNH